MLSQAMNYFTGGSSTITLTQAQPEETGPQTENGAVSYDPALLEKVVAVFYQLVRPSWGKKPPTPAQLEQLHVELSQKITEVFNGNALLDPSSGKTWTGQQLATALCAHLRHPRGGKGERAMGRSALRTIQELDPVLFENILLPWLIEKGGRLDDLFSFQELGVRMVAELLQKDQEVMIREWHRLCTELSQQGKFTPSTALAALLQLSPAQLRRDKTKLRDFLSLAPQELKAQKVKQRGEPITLMGKWAPTEGSALDKQGGYVKQLLKLLRCNRQEYRQLFLTPLRTYLNVVEAKMSARLWDEIDPTKDVPSRAMTKYRKALANRLGDRWTQFMEKVKTGEVKMKADQLYPHDLVRHYIQHGYGAYGYGHSLQGLKTDEVIEAQWKEMVAKYAADIGRKAIALVDVSGSMDGTPMEVAIALGLLTAEANKHCEQLDKAKLARFMQSPLGKQLFNANNPMTQQLRRYMQLPADNGQAPHPLNGAMITFHESPTLVTMPPADSSLAEKVAAAQRMPWGGSTNFQAAIDLLLQVAEGTGLSPDDLPEIMFVFSDMQFNQADRRYMSNFARLKQKFQEKGYRLPVIVFWNLRAGASDSPIDNDEEHGIVLLSGYSPDLLKEIMKGDLRVLTPLTGVLQVLAPYLNELFPSQEGEAAE